MLGFGKLRWKIRWKIGRKNGAHATVIPTAGSANVQIRVSTPVDVTSLNDTLFNASTRSTLRTIVLFLSAYWDILQY
jgi:hypothetical protein